MLHKIKYMLCYLPLPTEGHLKQPIAACVHLKSHVNVRELKEITTTGYLVAVPSQIQSDSISDLEFISTPAEKKIPKLTVPCNYKPPSSWNDQSPNSVT